MPKSSSRKRKKQRTGRPRELRQDELVSSDAPDVEFERRRDALREFLCRFNALDVLVSIGVSELWLPNRSSQVKHLLALNIALATPEPAFARDVRLATYEQFCEFHAELQRLLPRFPTMEDFVTEADWGEVCVETPQGFAPAFFGGSVERIPDFIEAFRVLRGDDPQALGDMHLALAIQGHIIREVDADAVGHREHIDPGHLETPTAEFWGACSSALLSTADAPFASFDNASPSLVAAELGFLRQPRSFAEFGNAVMTGSVVPVLAVRVGSRHVPISLRSGPSVVVDHWDAAPPAASPARALNLSRRVARFVSLRLRDRELMVGPLELPFQIDGRDWFVAAALMCGDRIQLVVPVQPQDLPAVGHIESRVKRLASQPKRWGLLLRDRGQVVEFRGADGSRPTAEHFDVLAVLAKVGTAPHRIVSPGKKVRVLALPDFVTIFDSLEDVDELRRFWGYVDGLNPIVGGMSGIADHFASFRDTDELLIGGATQPTFIGLDPHWNSSWRFKVLSEFWGRAPHHFPDGKATWVIDEKSDGLTVLRAKGPLALAWSGSAGTCTVQAILEVSDDVDPANGRLVELFVHCLADATTQRSALIDKSEPFLRDHIVVRCHADPDTLVEADQEPKSEVASRPLLNGWKIEPASRSDGLVVSVRVNLARLRTKLDQANDASFEAECLESLMVGICGLLGVQPSPEVLGLVRETASRQPRFRMQTTRRTVDVPEHADPDLPKPQQYKLARRDLALVLKDQGVVAPSRHELEPAKLVINGARDALRKLVHERIARFDRSKLLLFCIAQHDQVTAKYRHEVTRLQLSMKHQVSFNRTELLAKAHEELTTAGRNYRYLLECCLSLPAVGNATVRSEDVVQLIADVDWLAVLYGASDTLHNDIDVGGLEVDDQFIPTVFFSEGREEQERLFLEEFAAAKLGIDLNEDDEVTSEQEDGINLEAINDAFAADVGFSLSHLVQTLAVLSRWYSAGGAQDLQFCYRESPAAVASKLVERLPEVNMGTAERIVEFLTLDPAGIRRLAGKDTDEPDVPTWEHNKRVHRYLIRPLVKVQEDLLAWGAATVKRSSAIWLGTLTNGYLPADFAWPNVISQVRGIKAKLEAKLEVRAFEVCSRATPFAIHGIDFKRRFPKEGFDDVGDFDVLAYWPARNLWLSVECKYNQPPFCLKDGRRLRERIFGAGKDHGQFQKIERRRVFLSRNVAQLRELLKWPEGAAGLEPRFLEVYVSRDIYWWMRNPPYVVPTEFVRVDALDNWLRSRVGAAADLGRVDGM
jgi:hypothetical protein